MNATTHRFGTKGRSIPLRIVGYYSRHNQVGSRAASTQLLSARIRKRDNHTVAISASTLRTSSGSSNTLSGLSRRRVATLGNFAVPVNRPSRPPSLPIENDIVRSKPMAADGGGHRFHHAADPGRREGMTFFSGGLRSVRRSSIRRFRLILRWTFMRG